MILFGKYRHLTSIGAIKLFAMGHSNIVKKFLHRWRCTTIKSQFYYFCFQIMVTLFKKQLQSSCLNYNSINFIHQRCCKYLFYFIQQRLELFFAIKSLCIKCPKNHLGLVATYVTINKCYVFIKIGQFTCACNAACLY